MQDEGYYYTLDINVNREEFWMTSLSSLTKYEPALIALKKLEIYFDEEEGIDAGGLYREWFTTVFKECVKDFIIFFIFFINSCYAV